MFNPISAIMFDFSGVEPKWYLVLLTVFVAIVAFAVISLIVILIQKKRGINDTFSTKDLTYASVCITMSFVLSFFGYTMPQGGTVSAFSTVPIMIYCYYFGFKKGSVVCTINMLLQFLQNPYIVHVFSAVLDYMLPYMFLSIVGMFSYSQKRVDGAKNVFAAHYPLFIGSVIYVVLRYASHVLSGVLFFAEYAGANQTVWGYSMAYNSFVFVDFALSIIAVAALISNKSFNTFMASHRNTLQNANTRAEND